MNTITKFIAVALLLSSSAEALNPECSAHPLCRGLSGDCCPTTNFVYRKPILSNWRFCILSSSSLTVSNDLMFPFLECYRYFSPVSQKWTVAKDLDRNAVCIQLVNVWDFPTFAAQQWYVQHNIIIHEDSFGTFFQVCCCSILDVISPCFIFVVRSLAIFDGCFL